MVGADRSDIVIGQQLDEVRRAETLVPRLDHMTQPDSVMLGRKQRKKGREIVRFELLRRHELPQDGPEPVVELSDALVEKFRDRGFGFRQHLAVGAVAAGLERK